MMDLRIIDVTSDNVYDTGICCIKDKLSKGYNAKVKWFKSTCYEGLHLKIAKDSSDKQVGFIEYLPSELAWRPVKAINYMFIHCIAIYVKDKRNAGLGSLLIQECEKDAIALGKDGICVITSSGTWMAGNHLFEKNGFIQVDHKDRFYLLMKKINSSPDPEFLDWEKQLPKYSGWNLIYADQCPWHQKSVTDLQQCASEFGINLNIIKLNTPEQAQSAPSGFGTFSLIRDGRILADHYISETRFKNIIKQELSPTKRIKN